MMRYLTADEAERIVTDLELKLKSELTAALESRGHSDDLMDLYASMLANAENENDYAIHSIRSLPDGDVVADTIRKIHRIHSITKPIPAPGRMKMFRLTLIAALVSVGFLSAPTDTQPYAGIMGAAAGYIIGYVIGYFRLGGMPEHRHALSLLMTPRVQRGYAKLGEVVGPSAATFGLHRLRQVE